MMLCCCISFVGFYEAYKEGELADFFTNPQDLICTLMAIIVTAGFLIFPLRSWHLIKREFAKEQTEEALKEKVGVVVDNLRV
jgi:hypothetical protein